MLSLIFIAKSYTTKEGYPDFITGVSDSVLTLFVLFIGSLLLLFAILFIIRKIITRKDPPRKIILIFHKKKDLR